MLTTALIVLPLTGALAVFLLPASKEWVGSLALFIALSELGIWISSATRFEFGSARIQFEQRHSWISDLGISYHVGLYTFSFWLVGLAAVVMAAAIAYALWAGRERANAYFGLMLFLLGAVVCVFAAQDLILFYVAFEAMMIPLYVLIGVWGGERRIAATFKFVAYTMAGSLLMLVSIVVYGLSHGFDLTTAQTSGSIWLCLGFVVAFAVKAPLFPLHGWLPDAYRESPPEVAAVLSGLISKVAAFGFLRIVLTQFPAPLHDLRAPLLAVSAVGLIYGSLLAFRAPDIRGVVAYSSLAQMSLIGLGIFSAGELALSGSVLQMVNHGLVSTALFLLAGMIESRASSGALARLGGFARGRPILASLIVTIAVISLAVPGSGAFAGEFLILAGAFQQGWGWALVGLVAIVLAAMYMLRLVSAVLHREVGEAVSAEARDLGPTELCIVGSLLVAMLALSVWPTGISRRSWACLSQTQTISTQSPPPGAQVGLYCVSKSQSASSSSTTNTGAAP
ncbi:MAG: NADH-quinone oxidoreductase subunit M [Gaiellaceae bacterium]|jgi:NADH-quinone oxidoreductase subunit M